MPPPRHGCPCPAAPALSSLQPPQAPGPARRAAGPRGEETAAGGRRHLPRPRQAQPGPRRALQPEGGRARRWEGLRPGGQPPQVRRTAPAWRGGGPSALDRRSVASGRVGASGAAQRSAALRERQPRSPYLPRLGRAAAPNPPRRGLPAASAEPLRRGSAAPSALRGLRPHARPAWGGGGQTRATPQRYRPGEGGPGRGGCCPGTRLKGSGSAPRRWQRGGVGLIGSSPRRC